MGAAPSGADTIERAKKEGSVVLYTSVDLAVAERVGKVFEAKYPGIKVQIERTGSERVFQRLGQELQSNIHNADVVNSSDAAHFLVWKKAGILAKYQSAEIPRYYPKKFVDSDGYYATWRASLAPIAYNTRLLAPADAPKSFADLLLPKYQGKIVKSHPGYSGNTMSATYQVQALLGWKYFEGLAKQKVMQVQSATEPAKILANGERAIMADGTEYNVFEFQAKGAPLAVVYPTEGTPFVSSPVAILKDAPHPNASRLFVDYLFSQEAQQLLIDFGGLRSVRFGMKEPASRTPISRIKLLHEDPAGVEAHADEIKTKYAQIFGT